MSPPTRPGLIVPLGAWVLEEAYRQAACWRSAGRRAAAPTVHVDLSRRQFGELLGQDRRWQ